MNAKLLLQVRDTILAEPDTLDMDCWSAWRTDGTSGHVCGAVHCIAGWAMVLAGVSAPFDFGKGARTLGLREAEAKRLFYVDNWPREFCSRYLESTSDAQSASAAAERIMLFIASEGLI